MLMRKFALATGVAALLAFSAGTASAETVLNRGIGATIGTLDPHINFLAWEGWVLDDAYEGLVGSDAAGAVIPGAAEKWDISDDGLTYTFHLRAGLKWSNGDPLSAQDFVDGIIRTISPDTASDKSYIFTSTIRVAGAQDFVEGKSKDPKSVGISAPDASTLVLKLDAPAPHTLFVLGSFYAPPLHKASLEKFGKDFIKPGNIVTNGAYILTENVPQSHVTLEKNPNYWDAASVKIDKVVYRVTEDDSTAVKLWRAGELDTTADIPTAQIDALQGEFGEQVHISASTETNYMSFNITKPPFDNIKLRQALSMAIDRETLVNKVVKGGYVVNYGYVVPIPGYDAPKVTEAGMSKEDRVAKAKALYAEAGFGPDKPVSLTIESSNNDAYKKQAETIAVMWKQVLGVDAKVNAQDRDGWLAAFNAGGWDVFNDNLIGDFPGPETYLAYMDPRAEVGYHWKSPAFEAAFDKAMPLTDQAERWKVLAEAEKALLDDYLVAPIASSPNRHLIGSKLQGWVDNPADVHPTRFMSLSE
ncbi:peptide ABC transporter substrate-binding protein [Dongia sp.]|uniref:peptide ABC transporter substrate-binding protein n=1 Tax=Dongia sp. TaxID=1977262 RepID=UPI0035B016C6